MMIIPSACDQASSISSSLARRRHRWVVVLAAGEGRRLRSMARGAADEPLPKQYWSPDGRATMLERTLARADRLVPRERIMVVVAEQHRDWWEPMLKGVLPPDNIVVQPRNRGTAAGILLPVLRIAERHPQARLAILPSDHGVVDEWTLLTALEEAYTEVERRPQRMVLLGMPGTAADCGYGWITPVGAQSTPVRAIRGFVEKPSNEVAMRLLGEGALISSFLLVADLAELVAVYERVLPDLWTAFRGGHARREACAEAIAALYEILPDHDFSRDLLTPAVDDLAVLPVRPCGWSDLGTPDRVRQYRQAMSQSRQVGPAVLTPSRAAPWKQGSTRRSRSCFGAPRAHGTPV